MTHFVVALQAEAKPLIDHYRLERIEDGVFPVFEGGGRRLVVSGVGKVAAAAATAYVWDTPLDVWVNLGIAGHRARAPGEIARASRVRDASTGARYYPTRVDRSPLDTEGLTTVEAPETAFVSEDLFDMEASGFYPTALRFSTSELVHCVKIVSDNLESGIGALTAKRVRALVENNLDSVTALVGELEALATDLEPLRATTDLQPFLRSWHFTTSQRRRLSRLLSRHKAFGRSPSTQDLSTMTTASDVLARLSDELELIASEQQSF
jgi:hypothetical protein